MARQTNEVQKGSVGLIVVAIVVVLALAAGGYLWLTKGPGSSSTSTYHAPNPIESMIQSTPYDKISAALNKTIAAKTVYLAYTTKITSHITSAKTGVTQTLNNNVDGTISGSTDGKTMSSDMKIYSDLAPDKSVNVSVLNTENGDWYIRNAQTAPKWQKLTKAQYDGFNSGPTDASLFGLNILGSIFSNNKALFKSVNKTNVTSVGDETIGGVQYSKYSADVSTPDYLAALASDKDLTPKDVSDSKAILSEAIITVIFYVDKNNGYVSKLHINANKLSQITTPESIQLGLSVTHDVTLDGTLSRFDVPTNIAVPSGPQVLGISTELQMPSLVK